MQWAGILILPDEEQQKRLKYFKVSITANNRMKEFDPVIFEKLVEKVIVGGIDEDGNSDPYQLTFILKIGISNIGNGSGDAIRKIGLNSEKSHSTQNNIIEDDHCVTNDTCRNHYGFNKEFLKQPYK